MTVLSCDLKQGLKHKPYKLYSTCFNAYGSCWWSTFDLVGRVLGSQTPQFAAVQDVMHGATFPVYDWQKFLTSFGF